MDRRRWVIRGLLGGMAWAWLGLGMAQAGVVPPIRADLTLDTSATVTVSLYQLDSTLPAAASVTLQSPSRCTTSGTAFYKDVTDCWLPEWNPASGGKSVYVVVNGAPDVPTLVAPAGAPTFPLAPGTANPFLAALTTSAYPGQCTNLGSGAEPDFLPLGPPVTLLTSAATSVVGYELKPTDCGGIAVIQVGSLKFLLPKDGSTGAANGLPDVWKSLYGGNLDPAGDPDTGPAASSPLGDGLSTFDEYRGFIVSGKQIRTDPKQKDLFLRVVTSADAVLSPACGTSCLGGGTTTYPVSGSIFAVVHTLVSPERVHLLQATEWVDKFTSVTPSQTLNITDFVTDRTVNANRVYGPVQKGMRVMEGLNVDSPSTLGWAYGIGSPNEAGNVIVFSQRVINYITNTLIGTATTLKFSTASLVNGAWTWSSPVIVDRTVILSKAFQFYTGMEVLHSLNLTPDLQGTSRTSYGHHFAPGTGDCLDQAITATSKSGVVTFNIPSMCGSADQAQAHIH